MVRKLYRMGLGPYEAIPQYAVTKPNKRIRVDHKTGRFFELGKLERQLYKDVMEETKLIQEKMKDLFGFEPKDKEVAVAYKDEAKDKFDQKKVKVVEMEKERPAFFSANLMQKAKANSKDESSTTVRPSGLG